MTTVLVTDGDQRASLACVRSLGRAGFRVLVTSGDGRSLAGASRHAAADLRLPGVLDDADGFVAGLEALVRAREVDVLLPVTEQSLRAVLPRRERFGGAALPFPDAGTFAAASDKDRVLRAAEEVGIPTPPGRVVADPASALEPELPFPVALKASRSVVESAEGLRKTGVRYAGDAGELRRLLEAVHPAEYPLLVQRRIEGPGVGVFLLVWEGRTRAAFCHRRLREKPPSGGVSVYRESIPLDPVLLERSEDLLRSLGWQGVAMVEYKVDARTGEAFLMEINGRFWGSLQLAVDAGVDFPALLVRAALGRELPDRPGPYRAGVRSRWLWGGVDHAIGRLRGEAGASWPTRLRTVASVAGGLVPWRPGDRWEVLRPSDPRPFLRESRQWFQALGG